MTPLNQLTSIINSSETPIQNVRETDDLTKAVYEFVLGLQNEDKIKNLVQSLDGTKFCLLLTPFLRYIPSGTLDTIWEVMVYENHISPDVAAANRFSDLSDMEKITVAAGRVLHKKPWGRNGW